MQPISPWSVAAYSIGFVLAIPTLIALIRFIFAVAQFVTTVKSTVKELAGLVGDMKSFRHDIRNEIHWHDIRLTLVERELKMEAPPYPEERT